MENKKDILTNEAPVENDNVTKDPAKDTDVSEENVRVFEFIETETTQKSAPKKQKKIKKIKDGFKFRRPNMHGANKFRRFLKIYAICLGIVFLSALAFLYSALYQFEQSQPQTTINKVADNFTPHLYESLKTIYEPTLCEYESWDVVFDSCFKEAFGEDFKIKKAVRDYTAQRPVYTVYTDKDIAKVALKKSDKTTAFGLSLWDVESVTIIADLENVSTFSRKIEVPSGSIAAVNGIPLSKNKIAESRKYTGGCGYDDTDKMPQVDVYEITGLYLEPTVTATKDGENLTSTLNNTMYHFSFPSSMTHDLTVTVPYNATVTLGTKKLTSDLITENNIPFALATKYDNAHYVKYTVKSLLTDPTLTVVSANGKTMHHTQDNFYPYTDDLAYTLMLCYPSYASSVKINGADASGIGKIPSDKMPRYPFSSNISQYISGHIPLDSIYIEKIWGEPILEVLDAKSSPLNSSLNAADGKVIYSYLPSVDDTLKETYEHLAISYTEDYIKYCSGGYKIVNQTFAVAAAHLLADSPAYKKLESTKFSFGQNKAYTVNKKEIVTYDYRQLGDNTFSCLVDFTVYVTTSYDVADKNQKDEIKGMALTYSFIDGKWQIVDLKM